MVAHADRRERIRRAIEAEGLDALLVSDLVNVRYLTGFTGSAGLLLLGREAQEDRIATDGRYAEQVGAQAPELPPVITRSLDWLSDNLRPDAVLGLEADAVAWTTARAVKALLPGGAVRPTSGLVEELRAVKDDDEISAIAEACRIAGEALLTTLEVMGPGRTERELATVLERAMVDLGAQDRAFPSIVAAGPNGANPHHRPTCRAMEAGDLVTIDFGAQVGGYRSDMTRMVALGEPGQELRAVLDLVAASQRAGLDAVREGATGGAVDAICRTVIDAAGRGPAFVHGTGHGVGMEVHEAPRLSPGAGDTLRSRMVVTIEPGVYLPGLGGARIEDTVVVGSAAPQVLTTIPTDLVVL